MGISYFPRIEIVASAEMACTYDGNLDTELICDPVFETVRVEGRVAGSIDADSLPDLTSPN